MKHNEIHHRLRRTPQAELTGRISASAGVSATSLVLDSRIAWTTYTRLVTLTTSSDGVPVTVITPSPSIVLDSAVYSSLSASEASARSSQTITTATPTGSTVVATSPPKNNGDDGKLVQLLPAIVVPVAAVLILSFAGFWFFMHRKHKKRLAEESQFVMTKNVSRETSKSSRSSSTRELVPLSKLEKSVVVTTTEIKPPAGHPDPPKGSSNDVGAAQSTMPSDRYMNANSGHTTRAVPNFSAPRPTTSHRNRAPRDHARDIDTTHGGAMTLPRQPPMAKQAVGHPNSDTYRGHAGSAPRYHHTQSPVRHDRSPIGTAHRSPPRRADYAPVNNGHAGHTKFAPPSPSTPTGAFNGASPISQYSPIVKAMSSLSHTTPPSNAAAAQAGEFPREAQSASTMQQAVGPTGSPTDDNVLSAENMRIARLADSSRLGSNSSPTGESPHIAFTRTAPSFSSASLVQRDPASRSRATTSHPPESPGASSSIYTTSTPAIGALQSTPSINTQAYGAGTMKFPGKDYRVSVVSQVSSNDGFEDIDAKSDVSSLDERDRWESAHDTATSASHHPESFSGRTKQMNTRGPNSQLASLVDAPARSSAAGTVVSSQNTNMRDRDSEGPFVLSRY